MSEAIDSVVTHARELQDRLDTLNNRLEELTNADEFIDGVCKTMRQKSQIATPQFRAACSTQFLIRQELSRIKDERDEVAVEAESLRRLGIPAVQQVFNEFVIGGIVFERTTI